MLIVVTDRKTGDTEVAKIDHIEDRSRGTRTLCMPFLGGDNQGEIDLHTTRVEILPDPS